MTSRLFEGGVELLSFPLLLSYPFLVEAHWGAAAGDADFSLWPESGLFLSGDCRGA